MKVKLPLSGNLALRTGRGKKSSLVLQAQDGPLSFVAKIHTSGWSKILRLRIKVVTDSGAS